MNPAMNPFVRFILFLLIAGSGIAFGIVLLADLRGARHQSADMAREKALFSEVVDRFNGQQRHGAIAVEWQKVDASQQVLESSLLVRIYTLGTDGREVSLPIERVVIPHNRVCVEGLKLHFDDSFSDDYKDLRGATLFYFRYIHADGDSPEDGLSLLSPYEVPRATQMHADRTTQFELQLWQYLWDLIERPRQAEKNGLAVEPPPPTQPADESVSDRASSETTGEKNSPFIAARAVTNGTVYTIYVGSEGTTITEDNDPPLFQDMRREAAGQDADNGQDQSIAQ
jgi:hypothetical protein